MTVERFSFTVCFSHRATWAETTIILANDILLVFFYFHVVGFNSEGVLHLLVLSNHVSGSKSSRPINVSPEEAEEWKSTAPVVIMMLHAGPWHKPSPQAVVSFTNLAINYMPEACPGTNTHASFFMFSLQWKQVDEIFIDQYHSINRYSSEQRTFVKISFVAKDSQYQVMQTCMLQNKHYHWKKTIANTYE